MRAASFRSQVKRPFVILLAFLAILHAGPIHARDLTGAGSTFAYPIMVKWADAYFSARDVKVNYQSIGSGGGTKQIIAGTVDFALSDVPLEAKRLDELKLNQAPLVRGQVMPVVRLDAIGSADLNLNGHLLAEIYLGRINRWDDSRIRAVNPGLKFPDQSITTVHRADGSGTTYTLTKFLSNITPAWQSEIGTGTAVRWPCGVGGKGNDGVGAFVKRIDGSIGYVEAAFVHAGHLKAARMPDPIWNTTYVLLPRGPHPSKSVYKFLSWTVSAGGPAAHSLSFEPLKEPERIAALKMWEEPHD